MPSTVQMSNLMPQVSVQGQAFRSDNQTAPHTRITGGQVVAQLTVPIYQGGAEYSQVRQARQSAQQARQLVDDQRRNVSQSATQAWEQLQSSKAQVDAQRAAIRASEIALDGVQREAIVGSRTTLEVLNQEQELLQNRTDLVQALATVVSQSYTLAGAIGRLTAQDLGLDVDPYDMRAYYNAVRNRWFGLGDYSDVGGEALMAEERPGTPGTAPAPGAAADPSMEDILASIRRILSEDEAAAAPPPPLPPSPVGPALAAPSPDGEEPFDLTEEMLVPVPPPAEAPVRPAPSPVVAPPVAALPAVVPPAPDPVTTPLPDNDRALLGSAAAAAAAASVGTLLRAVAADRSSQVHRGGPSIEDVVREEVRPLLKEWLDQHLPPLVERLVRAEIERVVGRGLS